MRQLAAAPGASAYRAPYLLERLRGLTVIVFLVETRTPAEFVALTSRRTFVRRLKLPKSRFLGFSVIERVPVPRPSKALPDRG